MEAFLVSAGVVALAEIGDKSQLFALLLAARFRRHAPVIAAMFVATLASHAIAGIIGAWLSQALAPEHLRWLVGGVFLAVACWVFVPDRLEDHGLQTTGHGVFWTTLVTFFVAEMADKTQLATVALVVRFEAYFTVVAGSTMGMMVVAVPAVMLGERLARRLPVGPLRLTAAVVFVTFGLLVVTGGNEGWGL
jgi:Ca2+/H+ antiporter, TMEM165/GDT1 family